MSHELSAYFRYAPLGFLPRLELRFFNNRRTCSCEYDSAKPSSTILSANNRNVQRARPSGALLQATAIKRFRAKQFGTLSLNAGGGY